MGMALELEAACKIGAHDVKAKSRSNARVMLFLGRFLDIVARCLT
jgi:hypothetical protein